VFKHVQAEVAEEQLKETAMGEGRLTAKKGRMIRLNSTSNTIENAVCCSILRNANIDHNYIKSLECEC